MRIEPGLQFGVGRRRRGAASSMMNSIFWRHPPAHDRVVAIESQRERLRDRRFLAHPVVDQALQLLGVGGRCQTRSNCACRLRSCRARRRSRSGASSTPPVQPAIQPNSSAPSTRKCSSGSRISRACDASRRGRCSSRFAMGATACTRSATCRRAPASSSALLRHLDAEALGVVRRPARRRDLDHAHVVDRAQLRDRSPGPSTRVISSGAPMVLVQVALATSTVLPTGGSLPSAPGLRPPDQATS